MSDGATFCPECGQIIQQQETSRNASQSYWNDYKTNAEKDENERKALEARAIEKCKSKRRTMIAIVAVITAIAALFVILSILVDTFISKISLPMQPVPEIGGPMSRFSTS